MKIVIVGLPMFAERLAKGLSTFDASNSYLNLNTYYSRKDKLRAIWHVPKADCVFSINGTIVSSRLFDLALKKNVPLVMNWVGTDVLKSMKAFKEGNYNQDYIDKATHYCEVSWIQNELKTMGIHAEIVNFAGFDKSYDLKKVTDSRLNVLSYVADHRPEFYGLGTLIRVAKKHPSIHFRIVGTEAAKYQPLPENMDALGWVKNMNEVFDKSHVAIRFTEHDGLSTFILESLARGKQVLYRNPFEYCHHCPEEENMSYFLNELESKLTNGENLVNTDGAQMIQDKFNKKLIYSELLIKIRAVVAKK